MNACNINENFRAATFEANEHTHVVENSHIMCMHAAVFLIESVLIKSDM